MEIKLKKNLERLWTLFTIGVVIFALVTIIRNTDKDITIPKGKIEYIVNFTNATTLMYKGNTLYFIKKENNNILIGKRECKGQTCLTFWRANGSEPLIVAIDLAS